MAIVLYLIYGEVSDCEFSSIDKIGSVDETILTFLIHTAENIQGIYSEYIVNI